MGMTIPLFLCFGLKKKKKKQRVASSESVLSEECISELLPGVPLDEDDSTEENDCFSFWKKMNKQRLPAFPERYHMMLEEMRWATTPTPSEEYTWSTNPATFMENKGKMSPTPSEKSEWSISLTPIEENEWSTSSSSSEGSHCQQRTIVTHSPHNIKTPSLSFMPANQKLCGGLRNFGTNCYVNASLQCLFKAEIFCKDLSSLIDNSLDGKPDKFLRCFLGLWRSRNSSKIRARIDRDTFLRVLIETAGKVNPKFTTVKQNDAHEFLSHCLNQIEESGTRLGWKENAEPRCPVKSNFKFQMRNMMTCSSCGSQTNKDEVFNYLSVPLLHDSVDQCLYNMINNPTEFDHKCEVCEGESATSRMQFHTLPRFLILHLNRFKITQHYIIDKMNTPIAIEHELQIKNIFNSDTPRTENSQAETNQKEFVQDRQRDTIEDDNGLTSTYRLISVMSHIGSTTFYGHYVTDCCSNSPGEWITYNDDWVTVTTETDVLQKRSTEAYVLLYERGGSDQIPSSFAQGKEAKD